jgi:hypothetical protein
MMNSSNEPIHKIADYAKAPAMADLTKVVMFLQQSGKLQTARLAGVIIQTPTGDDAGRCNLEALWNEGCVPQGDRAEILRQLLEAHLQSFKP